MTVKHGTIRKCTIDGPEYPVRKDQGAGLALSQYVKEVIANGNGSSSIKITASELESEAFNVTCSLVEAAIIAGIADDLDKAQDGIPINLTLVDGTKAKAPCNLSVGKYDTMEGQLPITVTPLVVWEIFSA